MGLLHAKLKYDDIERLLKVPCTGCVPSQSVMRGAHLGDAVPLDSDVLQRLAPHAIHDAVQAHDFLDDCVCVRHVLQHIICTAP